MLWRRLLRTTDTPVGRIADWSTFIQLAVPFLGGGALLSWPASSIDVISQHGWGAVLFAGMAAASALVLVASIGLIAWRVFFPLAIPLTSPIELKGATDKENDYVELQSKFEDIDKKFGRHVNLISSSINTINSNFDRMNSNVNQIDDRLNGISKIMEPEPSSQGFLAKLASNNGKVPDNRFESLEDKISRAEDSVLAIRDAIVLNIKEMRNDIVEINKRHADYVVQFRTVLIAERAKDRFDYMTAEIDRLIERLEDPISKPELYEDWRTWANEERQFRSLLFQLCRTVQPYVDLKDEIFDTPPDKLKSQHWSFDFAGMNDDQKLDYKTFRIVAANYEEAKSKMSSEIINVVYAIP